MRRTGKSTGGQGVRLRAVCHLNRYPGRRSENSYLFFVLGGAAVLSGFSSQKKAQCMPPRQTFFSKQPPQPPEPAQMKSTRSLPPLNMEQMGGPQPPAAPKQVEVLGKRFMRTPRGNNRASMLIAADATERNATAVQPSPVASGVRVPRQLCQSVPVTP